MPNDIKSSPAGKAAAAAMQLWHAALAERGKPHVTDEGPPSTFAQIVPLVRARLRIDAGISDETMIAALAAITAHADQRGRWMAAFNSELGQALAATGRDLNTALRVLIALAPEARS